MTTVKWASCCPLRASTGSARSMRTGKLHADAYQASEDEWIESGRVTARFINLAVTTTMQYECVYDWNPGDGPSCYFIATLNGSGTAPGRTGGVCASTCDGKLTRYYFAQNCNYDITDSEFVCVDYNMIGGDSTHACRASVSFHTVSLDGGVSVEVPASISLSLGGALFAGIITQSSAGRVDTLSYGVGATVWPDSPMRLSFDESGLTVDTTWSWQSEPGEMLGTKTANLRVTVTVE